MNKKITIFWVRVVKKLILYRNLYIYRYIIDIKEYRDRDTWICKLLMRDDCVFALVFVFYIFF